MQVMERGTATIAGDGKFHVVTVPHGTAVLRGPGLEKRLPTGQSLLLPAAMESCQLAFEEPGTILAAHLPG